MYNLLYSSWFVDVLKEVLEEEAENMKRGSAMQENIDKTLEDLAREERRMNPRTRGGEDQERVKITPQKTKQTAPKKQKTDKPKTTESAEAKKVKKEESKKDAVEKNTEANKFKKEEINKDSVEKKADPKVDP